MRWNLIVWLKSSSGIFHVCFFLISFYFRKPKSQFDETVYNAFQPFSFSVIICKAIDSWKSIPPMTNAASQAGSTWNHTVLALLIYNLHRFVFYTTRARNIITLLILFHAVYLSSKCFEFEVFLSFLGNVFSWIAWFLRTTKCCKATLDITQKRYLTLSQKMFWEISYLEILPSGKKSNPLTVKNVEKNVRERSHSRVCSWTVGHFVGTAQNVYVCKPFSHTCVVNNKFLFRQDRCSECFCFLP